MKLDESLDRMIDEYAAAIKMKLLQQQQKGYSGYSMSYMQGPIEQKLAKNFIEKDWIDVGALAAMRWDYGRRENVYEDELPEDISDEEYSAWHGKSVVDGVRIGPKLERNRNGGEK